MNTIKISYEHGTRPPVYLQRIKKGSTLLEVLLENNIDLHHDCGGICACTTCHIYVHQGQAFLDEMQAREKHFIKRVKDAGDQSRLACQSLLVADKGNLAIVIPGQSEQPFL